MTLDEWIKTGIDHGYCGPIVCDIHDGTPTTETEDSEFDDGSDPCIPIIRIYQSEEERLDVEANHPPSNWRKPQ